MKAEHYDVAVIGGGPAGSTVACLLKRYRPELRIGIFEREVFPRDHVGESLLPPISPILIEMGCWEKVEAANFPIKIGATLRWGKNPELWDFEFFPAERFRDEPRPARFEGQRRLTSFQVDRAVFDDILLSRAAELGCEVQQGVQVRRVLGEGDSVTGLEVAQQGTEELELRTARHYVDASGNCGILRRGMGVECEYPTSLQNIAIWDYWQNAEWAVKIGVGATRIQVRSIGYGWLWFIPLGPTRTSVGLVIPAEHFKSLGRPTSEVYSDAIKSEREIARLLENATSEERLQTTRDWSFIARRQCGENWFLIGEAAGFADPILSAGVSMSMIGAQQAAFTILELDRGELPASWLKDQFEERQARRIKTHISFADYWYTTNAQFTDLKDFTAMLARENGLELTPDGAWRWLAQGGFIDEDLTVGVGGWSLLSIRSSGDFLSELNAGSPLEENNVLELDLSGATYRETAAYQQGRVVKSASYVRGSKTLPLRGAFGIMVKLLQQEKKLPRIVDMMQYMAKEKAGDPTVMSFLAGLPEAMEGMIRDGWIMASRDPSLPMANVVFSGAGFRHNRESA